MNLKKFYSEIAYIVGIILLAFGTALMEHANFGMSMIVAPAYLFHLKISQTFSFFTFGMAEYCLQFILLVLLSIILRRFRIGYLFSFVTAIIYGFILDFGIYIFGFIPAELFYVRAILFAVGFLLCALGVAFLFHTYLAPEAYELVVKEISAKFGKKISRVKIVYDLTSLVVSVVLSFAFFGFGHFEGVKWGTLITALLNGPLIGFFSGILDKTFEFTDLLSFRKVLE